MKVAILGKINKSEPTEYITNLITLLEKRNVSVYSRFSWQKEVKEGKFIHRNLGNNEKVKNMEKKQ